MKSSMIDVAIIGAGTAGALAANQLTSSGLNCCIVEKSRGVGGRCSRRSIPDSFSIDLGASSFSLPYTEHPHLVNNINHWLKSGYLTEWLFSSNDFQTQSPAMKKIELCGTPSMNAFHRHLVEGINCLTQRHVHQLKRIDGIWQLLDDSDQLIVEAKSVIITAPAEQTYNLVAPFDLIAKSSPIEQNNLTGQHELPPNPILIASQSSLPQYVCAIAFEQPQTQLSDVYSGEHPVFSKAIRANSKPNQPHSNGHQIPEVWILHSTHDWAKQHQHQDAKNIAKEMARLFCQHFNITDQVTPESIDSIPAKIVASHYWRLADHDHATIKRGFEKYGADSKPFLWNEALKLGCCADWLAGGGIAGALSSSQHLSNHITLQLRKRDNG